MEGPLLSKSEYNVDVAIHGDSSSNDDHIVGITISGDSSPTGEGTQHEAHEGIQSFDPYTICIRLNWVELVVTLVQIVAAIVVLTLAKDEQHPQKLFRTLIIGHTCGCIATLPIVCWRFWQYNRSFNLDPRHNEVMDKLKKMIEYFFVGWVVVLLWHVIDSSSLDYTNPHFWLCMIFLPLSLLRDVYPNLLCGVMCFFFPMITRIIQVLDVIDDIDYNIMYYCGIVVCILVLLQCICCRS